MIGLGDRDDRLIEELARRHDVPPELIHDLLGLEEEFPDMAVHGAKTGLERRIAEVISDGLRGTRGPAD